MRPFEDVPEEEWYYSAVYFNYEKGYMTGFTETSFAPQQNLTRAQLAAILYRMEGSPGIKYREVFPDVADGQWYTDAIMWAQENGIVTGYNNGNFGPHDNILREQIAVMMYRYATYKGYYIYNSADLSGFADAGDITQYAVEGMQWAVGTWILQGKADGTILDPLGNTNRAECAVIMQRFWDQYIAEK